MSICVFHLGFPYSAQFFKSSTKIHEAMNNTRTSSISPESVSVFEDWRQVLLISL